MLTEPQLQRFSRQLLLPEIRGAGQDLLLASKIEVQGAGAAADTLRTYLAAAGVPLGSGGIRVASPQAAHGARWVLDEVGVAWSSKTGGPCGDCLAAVLATIARPPESLAVAVAQAAGALAAAQVLLALVDRASVSAGAFLAWPQASRIAISTRSGCDRA